MFYRFLYITWRIFWSSILVLVATVLLFAGAVFLILQTEPAREYLVERAGYWFNNQFEGTLHIGEVGGFLPMNIELRDVRLEYEGQSVFVVETLRLEADLIALLRSHVTINDLALDRPVLFLRYDEKGTNSLSRALTRREIAVGEDDESKEQRDLFPKPLRSLDFYAPFMRIHDGLVHIENLPDSKDRPWPADLFRLQHINTEMFLEISSGERYLDISYLTLILRDMDQREVTLSGQIYNDRRFLEFNVMRLRVGSSHLDWDLEFDGLDLLSEDPFSQLRQAIWSVNVKEAFLSENEQPLLLPDVPTYFEGWRASFTGNGTNRTMEVRDVELLAGNSSMGFDGRLLGIGSRQTLEYEMDIHEIDLRAPDMAALLPESQEFPFRDWRSLRTSGMIAGNSDSLNAAVEVDLPEGRVSANGTLFLRPALAARFDITGEEIDPSAMQGWENYQGQVNAELFLEADDLKGDSPYWAFDLDLFNTRIGRFLVPDMHFDVRYSERMITHEFGYYQEENYLKGTGTIDLQEEQPHVLMRGSSSGFDLSRLLTDSAMPATEWSMNYDINWHGRDLDEWYGRVIVDVLPSVLNGEEVGSHQLYLDLNHPESDTRSLRLTSTIADLVMEGAIAIPSVPRLYQQWKDFLVCRINEDLLFRDECSSFAGLQRSDPDDLQRADPDDLLRADVLFEIKNLKLMKAYLPQFPEVASRARLQIQLHADHDSLSVRSNWRDEQTVWNGIDVSGSRARLEAEFHFRQSLRDAFLFDLELAADHARFMDQTLDSISWAIQVNENDITSQGRISNFGDDVHLSSDISGTLSKSELRFAIENLVVGNERYLWSTEGRPQFQYQDSGALRVEEFRMGSGEDLISIDGTFSSEPDDSVSYRFDNVNLIRISEMIDGKVAFQGILDGEFYTRNLTLSPVFQGSLEIERLAFNDRPVGDVAIQSSYNSVMDRFDTDALVITDESKYADYIEGNDNRRQHAIASGWFRAPDINEPVDSLYYFDVDVKEFDAWVLRLLMDSIFESIEGRAVGSGYITGNLSDFDFHGDFDIQEAEVVPVLLEPLYHLDGQISVNRHDGVAIHELNIRDAANGRGTVSGTFDFNDFLPEKFMDLTLSMRNLRFLDNSEGPEAPFYGRVAGTGVVNISGSNVSPFVRTIEPIQTTSQSRFSIPVVEEAVDEAQGRFIRFVQDFEDVNFRQQISTDPAVLRRLDRTFMEVFRLDLQFVAAPNSTVQLIFDPVTDEIVNAQGSGRVRITLEDEDLQIFGNFDITSGDYLFVGGDILTRRFILREGGSIRLEGDPANALLDITAVYRARPNIAPLLGAAPDQTNRVPVELLLRITGPIDNIENDFYFEFPNTIDATQNAAVLNVLNSEEQKLIQATSLLFTGGFISGALVGETQTQELGTTLQARAGQVGISQLLSTQINTLLSDNILNVDVDLNLLGFDQADLGIALWLFDDRLVLRREGEVGGEEATIGDLGATYRINPNLSVEVFHRKDPMLMSILGTQADVENVNGVGLEAQFRFNTWRDFAHRIWHNVSTVFGLVDTRDESQSETAPESAIRTEPVSEPFDGVVVLPAILGILEDAETPIIKPLPKNHPETE
ncbi:MAG: translocation/assembly module TamB domain-containing protein [Cyclonatronaceae bacterium]